MTPTDTLVSGVVAGDRRTLAKAITLVESVKRADRDEAIDLLDALVPRAGDAIRVGVSGAPGAGKSAFIEVLGIHLLSIGHRVAVLAVDPSSSRSGGSLLGDKTRMAELARHPDAFIRPSPARGDLGGVARRTRDVVSVCEAAGFDVVIVETVGVGQSEVAVAGLVDTFLLLSPPGAGDDLQGMKRGVMELADVVVITKSDGDLAAAAGRAEADHRRALEFIRPRHRSWSPDVVRTSAFTGEGIGLVWERVCAHRAALEGSGELDALRADQARRALWSEVREEIVARLGGDEVATDLAGPIEEAVVSGSLSAPSAARRLVDLLPQRDPD